jgi:hypothetical protein
MSLAWSDLGDTLAHATGNPVFSTPIPGVNSPYIFSQKFMQPTANYSPLALNTVHPTYGSYILVEESDFQDLGGSLQSWQRVYASIPAEHIEVQTDGYDFIGFTGEIFNNKVTTVVNAGRWRFHRIVNHKIVYDYFLVDGAIITDPTSIPIILRTRYTSHDPGTDIDFLWDDVGHGGVQTFPSIPSLTDYKAMVATDAATASSFSIVARDSQLSRWTGNIWRRMTLYVKAI